jgi:hypothetical protein
MATPDEIQEKTFCKWFGLFSIIFVGFSTSCRLNAKLEAHGYPPMNSLVTDLSDGVRLIQLMVSSFFIQSIEDKVLTIMTTGNHGSVSTGPHD